MSGFVRVRSFFVLHPSEIRYISNQRLISIATLWEISIKVSIGKLKLGIAFTELVEQEVYGNAIEILEISSEHLDELVKLPFHHKDPFDRLIITQSLVEDAPSQKMQLFKVIL